MVIMGNVWDRATEFLSDNLSAVVPIALFAIFLPMSLQANLAPLMTASPFAALLLALVVGIIVRWGQVAITALAIDPVAGRSTAIGIANKRLLPLIGVIALMLIAVMLLIAPIGVAMGLSGYDFTAVMAGSRQELPPATGAFVGIYGLVAVLVLIWAAARLALVYPIVVWERRGLGVFRRSFVLTRGITWKIIGVMVLFGIVATVAILAAKFVFGSLLNLVAGGEGDISVATVLTSILVGAVETAFTALLAAFVAKLYLAVRDRRESIVESGMNRGTR